MNPRASVGGCRIARVLFAALISFSSFSSCLAAEKDATADVAEALESMGRLPWYDPASESVEPIRVEPRIDDSVNRNSRWLPKPESQPVAANPAAPAGGGGTRTFGSGTMANTIGWVILGLLMIFLVGLLIYAFLRIEDVDQSAGGRAEKEDKEAEKDRAARLEKLPVQLRRGGADLLAEADRLRAAGQLEEAIVYLFGHQLLQLDRRHALRLARGKTNRQYLAELQGRPALQRILQNTVHLFEQSYFGRYPITPQQFDAARAQQRELESLLAEMREAA